MRVVCLEHVPFEGPGRIADWASTRGHALVRVALYDGQLPPESASSPADLLVVMGGPMGAMDDAQYPWMMAEKRAISAALTSGQPVLGVCLGAQLMAAVAGAAIRRQPTREIGWLPVHAVDSPTVERIGLPTSLLPLHWHGDTFDLPASAVHLYRSQACENQAFLLGDRAVALQFHIEATRGSLSALATHCADELCGLPVTTADLLDHPQRFADIAPVLDTLLDWLVRP